MHLLASPAVLSRLLENEHTELQNNLLKALSRTIFRKHYQEENSRMYVTTPLL